MPIKKSAIKKAKQDEVRRLRNRLTKIAFRSKMKAVKEIIANGETKELGTKLSEAFSALDKAAKKGVIHKNTASRKKSRLAKLIAAPAPETKKSGTKSAKKTKKTA